VVEAYVRPLRLENQVVIVTGGAGGIGESVSQRLAHEGATVVVADVEAERAEEVARRLGRSSSAIAFDAAEPESIARLVATTLDRYGRIDVLHNNAALMDSDVFAADTNAVDTPLELWERVFAINARAYFIACKHVLPHMSARGSGSIINTASVYGLAADETLISYGMSKAAVIALTKYIAVQHGLNGIRCNAIAPGTILTPHGPAAADPALSERLARQTLMGRLGTPAEVAALVAYLASDDASHVTGQVICCDGGLLAHLPFP